MLELVCSALSVIRICVEKVKVKKIWQHMSGTFLISKLVDTTTVACGNIERMDMNATIHFNKMVV